jgi:glycosyltransferase involved in cell wall biosynthesis
MNIVYYTNEFPKVSESFILNELSELQRRGHNLAVFALRKGDEGNAHEEYNDLDIPVYYVNLSLTDITRLLPKFSSKSKGINILQSTFPRFPMEIIGVNIIIRDHFVEFINDLTFDVDIIHGHFANNVKIAQIYTAQYFDIPSAVTAHAYEIFAAQTKDQIRYICENVDHVFVPSEYNRKYLQKEIGVENTFTMVPATTTIDKFEACEETVPQRIITVGRITEKKGHKYAIDAVAELVDQGYDIEYHIVGSGEMEEELRTKVKNQDLEGNISFLGYISDEQLRVELSEASIFTLPCVIASNGDRDAMPVVLKEAMAAETACISTNVSAIPELITDQENGLLVSPNNAGQLSKAIRALIENPEKRRQLAKSGKETVSRGFDISESVDRLETDMKKLAENK